MTESVSELAESAWSCSHRLRAEAMKGGVGGNVSRRPIFLRFSGGTGGSFSLCFCSFFFASFSVLVFGRLGCLFGVPFGSLWAPKLPQVGSKTALGTHLLIKSEFSKKRAPCGPQHDFEVSVGPKTPSSRPKIAPRGLQEALVFGARFRLRF